MFFIKLYSKATYNIVHHAFYFKLMQLLQKSVFIRKKDLFKNKYNLLHDWLNTLGINTTNARNSQQLLRVTPVCGASLSYNLLQFRQLLLLKILFQKGGGEKRNRGIYKWNIESNVSVAFKIYPYSHIFIPPCNI